MSQLSFLYVLFLAIQAAQTTTNYNWSVYLMTNDTYCQEIQQKTCIPCHNLAYQVVCENLPPYYDYWSDGITTASPCRVSYYTSDCKEFTESLQIQAYTSREDICSSMENIYDGTFCWFGATSPSYDPLSTMNIVDIIGIIIGVTLTLLVCVAVILYCLQRKGKINIFKHKKEPASGSRCSRACCWGPKGVLPEEIRLNI